MPESGKRQISATATLDFGSVPAQGNAVLTATVSGAKPGAAAMVSGPAGLFAGVAAQGTLTMDTNPTDGDTMTVDSKVYTFQSTLTDSDGNIQIGGTLADTKSNLVEAFDLSGTAGTDYAASMTAHPTVNIAAFVADDAVLTAKTAGTAGNSIATTETFTAGTNVFDAATLGTTLAGEDSSELVADAWVSAADTVSVRLVNAGAGAVDPASGDFDILVWQ